MKKLLAILLAAVMLFALAACTTTPGNESSQPAQSQDESKPDASADESKPDESQGEESKEPEVIPETGAVYDLEKLGGTFEMERPASYERSDEGEVYDAILGYFEELAAEAKDPANSVSERYVKFAKAEAYLLDTAVMIPTTTQGGAYTISRIAPRTVPYVQWGNDDDRVKGLIISDEFLTKEERTELLDLWKKAMAGEGEYDPKAYLEGKGHKINREYRTTFATPCATLDWLNTSMQSDTEVTVNTVDGLVEYNNLNQMKPALAESWDISEDGKTVTFHIRKGVYWYTSEGKQYAEVKAQDFEAGMRHMLDCQEGLEWLIDGIVVGGTAYYTGEGDWDSVGYKATDDYTLVVTLEQPTSYFLTMLTYSCFLPICKSFYEAQGGVFGVAEYKAASENTETYTFGQTTNIASQVYCGPFLLTKFSADSEIILTKNENYYKKDEVNIDSIHFIFDTGDNPVATYNSVKYGVYPGMGLRAANGTLKMAQDDGLFDPYSYVSDTTSTSYFGGLNLNRGTFGLESGVATSAKTDAQKIDTDIALKNKSFRQALQFAFDKGTQNAVINGDELKNANLRNMYTHPEFVSLEEDVTVDGKTWKAGTFYGEIVQWYLKVLGSPVEVADGIDGWYHPEEAKAALEAAKEELGDSVSWPIHIEITVYTPNANIMAQAQAYKAVIEDTLGADNVVVDFLNTDTAADYYACGYRAANGEAGNFDMFYGSGWGPDYGDPSTYVDTFNGYGAGYMTKVIGLF